MTDLMDKMIAWENGELSDEGTIELFQALIDNGMAWTLQGMYGRTAAALIEAGFCLRREERSDVCGETEGPQG